MPYVIPDVVPAGSMRDHPQPSIPAGETLQLRPWQERDLPAVLAAYSDPDIQRWHLETLDQDEAVARIQQYATRWQDETHANWAIADAASGEALGRTGLRMINLAEGWAEVVYWVLPSARRRGVAGQALQALVTWSFDELGLNRLELRHSVHNVASCRVATGNGFELEGVLRGYAIHPDGRHDYHMHGRLKP